MKNENLKGVYCTVLYREASASYSTQDSLSYFNCMHNYHQDNMPRRMNLTPGSIIAIVTWPASPVLLPF